MAVNDCPIFFFYGAGFPDFSEFTGGFRIFGDDDNAAGFAVEAIDEVRLN